MAQSIFTTQTPAQPNLTDATAYTLGTCFFPAVDGQITGIRWYGPGTAPTGTVTAGLYSITDESTGTLLASANFSSITPGAWNQVLFSSPVSVLANTHYVAVVLTPNRYIVTTDFFDAAALTNGDLTAIQQGVPFANGRLHVGATLTFPESSGGGSNFFVDVVFDQPAGSTVDPDGLAIGVAPGSPTLTWSGSVAPSGIGVPVALGSPTVGAASVAPDGVSVPAVLGSPTVTWTGAITPGGISVPVAPGAPTASLGGIAPGGASVPVALGAPSLTWSGAASPDGIAVPVGLGSAAVSQPGQAIVRPGTGTTSRPDTGTITRPDTGVTTRP